MPMHDWTKVTAGIYHNFHFLWMASISDRLNAGLLPPGHFAIVERVLSHPEGDVVLRLPDEKARYARKANRIAVHHGLGEDVAVIEILSPGNKDRKSSVETFVKKTLDLLWKRVNVCLSIDSLWANTIPKESMAQFGPS